MFQHLLVPLDGSSHAETALPLAAHIARSTGGTITLLRAVLPELGEAPYYYSRSGVLAEEVHETLIEDAQEYLERTAHSDLLQGISIHTQVLSELPAQAILHSVLPEHTDLIILCSHGYTGLKRWALGSVAQKITRHSTIPVVVLTDRSQRSSLYSPEAARPVRALVALDGSSLAEASLIPTAQLVALMSPSTTPGELHLMRVVKPLHDREERAYMKYDIDIRELTYREAKNSLNATRDWLTQELATDLKLLVTSSIEENADIATTLIRAAEMGSGIAADSYDLIALATHGRGGIKRWMIGSITERVLEEAKLPLLIVRPPTSMESSFSSEELPRD